MRFGEVFEPQTWEFARIAVRRMRQDRRSRKFLAELAGMAFLLPAVPLALVALLIAAVAAPQALGLFGTIVGLGIGFGFRYFSSQSKRQVALDAAAEAVPIEARRRILRTTFWLANLLRRNDSEIYIHEKELPAGMEVITRRLVLDRLKLHGIWEEMPEGVRELLIRPDGHWNQLDRNRVASLFEHLACLRWVTRKDDSLRLLALPPKYQYNQAREIAEDAEWLKQDLTVPPVQLDAPAKSALGCVNRCMIDAVSRGLVTLDSEQLATALKHKEASDPKSDWLYGHRSIGELTDDDLRFVHQRALVRWQTLRAVHQEMTSEVSGGGLQGLIAGVFPVQPQENEKHAIKSE